MTPKIWRRPIFAEILPELTDTAPADCQMPSRVARHDLGYIDLEQKTLQTIDNPFGSSLSPMS